VPLSAKPHLHPNFDLLLHQWRLLPSTGAPETSGSSGDGGGGGPLLGVFATLCHPPHGPPDVELPLSIRTAFRPVLTSPPNVPILLEAMLLTRGFSCARALVQGLIQGLREIMELSTSKVQRMYSSCDPPVHTAYNRSMNLTCACPSTHQEEESTLNSGESPADREHSSPEISQSVILATLHSVARQAVRTAAELMTPETARELKAARRKLGLASLTISERKAKT
ncbi:unnamed protein product, partial [Sphacelaria rigidula]